MNLAVLAALAIAVIIVAALPIVLYRRLAKPFGLVRRETIVGVLVFALFAMVLERGLHAVVSGAGGALAQALANPAVFVVYAALSVGLFEETGRWMAMRWLMRRDASRAQQPGLALAYGIGHGGAEAWIVGVLVQVQWLVLGYFAMRGDLDSHLSSLPLADVARIHLILGQLSTFQAVIFVVERSSAFVFQLGLSMLMWHGLRAGQRWILPLAIIVHALLDVPAALFQARIVPLVSTEAAYAVLAVALAVTLARRLQAGRA